MNCLPEAGRHEGRLRATSRPCCFPQKRTLTALGKLPAPGCCGRSRLSPVDRMQLATTVACLRGLFQQTVAATCSSEIRMLHSRRISDEQVAAFSRQVRERLRSADPAFRRAWQHLFVDRVVIGPDEIRILGPKRHSRKVSFRETSRPAPWCPALTVNGAPDTIRTCDLCLRRATLYPAELRALTVEAG